jgi:hypothetical protein
LTESLHGITVRSLPGIVSEWINSFSYVGEIIMDTKLGAVELGKASKQTLGSNGPAFNDGAHTFPGASF